MKHWSFAQYYRVNRPHWKKFFERSKKIKLVGVFFKENNGIVTMHIDGVRVSDQQSGIQNWTKTFTSSQTFLLTWKPPHFLGSIPKDCGLFSHSDSAEKE